MRDTGFGHRSKKGEMEEDTFKGQTQSARTDCSSVGSTHAPSVVSRELTWQRSSSWVRSRTGEALLEDDRPELPAEICPVLHPHRAIKPFELNWNVSRPRTRSHGSENDGPPPEEPPLPPPPAVQPFMVKGQLSGWKTNNLRRENSLPSGTSIFTLIKLGRANSITSLRSATGEQSVSATLWSCRSEPRLRPHIPPLKLHLIPRHPDLVQYATPSSSSRENASDLETSSCSARSSKVTPGPRSTLSRCLPDGKCR